MPSIHSVLGRIPEPVKRSLADSIYPEPLAEGETAPEFHLQGHDGEWYRFQRLRWTLLVFYPGDDTPGCTRQLEEVQAHLAELTALKCNVFGVNPAESASHAAFARKLGLEYPLLVDRGASVSRQFRCTLPVPFLSRVLRTVYLVNPDRKIRLANRGAPSVEAIIRSIQALQQATKDGM